MTAARLRRVWQGFVGLFGLDACPAPSAPARLGTAQQRARHARLAGLLRPGPTPGAPPPAQAERGARNDPRRA